MNLEWEGIGRSLKEEAGTLQNATMLITIIACGKIPDGVSQGDLELQCYQAFTVCCVVMPEVMVI